MKLLLWQRVMLKTCKRSNRSPKCSNKPNIPSLFVAGARPAIMWICALGLFTQFFIMPYAEWATVYGTSELMAD